MDLEWDSDDISTILEETTQSSDTNSIAAQLHEQADSIIHEISEMLTPNEEYEEDSATEDYEEDSKKKKIGKPKKIPQMKKMKKIPLLK